MIIYYILFYHIILYYFLYYIILYYTILYYTILYYIILLYYIYSFSVPNSVYNKQTNSKNEGLYTDSNNNTNTNMELFRVAFQDLEPSYFKSMDIQEKYLG